MGAISSHSGEGKMSTNNERPGWPYSDECAIKGIESAMEALLKNCKEMCALFKKYWEGTADGDDVAKALAELQILIRVGGEYFDSMWPMVAAMEEQMAERVRKEWMEVLK
jgi:hypothetical protein